MEANYNKPPRHATNLTLAPFDKLRVQFRVRLRGRARHDLRLFRDEFELKNVRRSARVVFFLTLGRKNCIEG